MPPKRPTREKQKARDIGRKTAEDRKRSEDPFLIPDEEYDSFHVEVSSPSPFVEYRSNIRSLHAAEEEKQHQLSEEAKLARFSKTGSVVPQSTISAKSRENQKIEEDVVSVGNAFSILSKAQARKAKKDASL